MFHDAINATFDTHAAAHQQQFFDRHGRSRGASSKKPKRIAFNAASRAKRKGQMLG